MKLSKHIPKSVVRIDIKGGPGNSKVITVEETTVRLFVMTAMSDVNTNVSVNAIKGLQKKLTVSCYEAMGDAKSKSKSMTLYGVDAEEVFHHLVNKIKDHEKIC